ncbi:MAG: NAD(P)-binding protein [Steroidobacteraceae bacterium]
MSSAYPRLFSPLTLRRQSLRNRVVHASMSTRYVTDGRVTDKLIDYHVNRARGGAAMLVTEPLNLLPRQRNPQKVRVLEPDNATGLARWAREVRSAGALLIGQIQDPGRGRHQAGRNHDAIGPSALPDDLSWTVPHALDTDEVAALARDFAAGAVILRNAGFAGVEISAGHGHLFHQFLAARSNRRSDRYGGALEARAKLLTDLCLELRARCGDEFLIGVKLPAEDGLAGGIGAAEAEAITRLVHATGVVDYLTWCWGSHSRHLGWHLPDLHGPRSPWVARIAELGRLAPGVAIGALGLITDPNEGERIVRDGLADLVMLGRPLLTDAAWARKAAEGREAEIRYCVSCNTCWGSIISQGTLACDNNPRVGERDEADWKPAPARKARRVVVVGAGPAGLEAAWVAAARGHDVTVFGSSAEVGGKTRLHTLLPGGENLSSVFDYQYLRGRDYGVRFTLGARAHLADVLALRPEVVVLATGATPAWPEWLPEDHRDPELFPDLRTLANSLVMRSVTAAATVRTPGLAVVYDHDHSAFTYATVQKLADRFSEVAIVTPREGVAEEEPLVNRQGIQRRLVELGVRVYGFAQPRFDERIAEGRLALDSVLVEREIAVLDQVALLAHAMPRVPNDELAAPLRAAGIEVHTIGDCHAPRSLLVATQEGNRIGLAI